MATRTFTLSTTVDADPGDVLDFLAALDRHHGLHPFLESAALVRNDPPRQEWQVVERPGFYRVRFRAVLTRLSPTELHTEVRAPAGVRLSILARMRGATLTQTTTVDAPWPLIAYVARNARRAHARTLGGLADRLS